MNIYFLWCRKVALIFFVLLFSGCAFFTPCNCEKKDKTDEREKPECSSNQVKINGKCADPAPPPVPDTYESCLKRIKGGLSPEKQRVEEIKCEKL